MLGGLMLIAAAPASLPPTPDGHPDLQGIWANDTVTMLERPSRFGDKDVFSEQEAAEYERDLAGRWKDRCGDLELTTTGELSPEWQEHGSVVPGTPESRARVRYDFTVEDEATYTQPWSGSLWITRTTAAIYEYACHEGNYSMAGILRGAREDDRRNRRER